MGFYKDARRQAVTNNPDTKKATKGKTNAAFDTQVAVMRQTLPKRNIEGVTSLTTTRVDVGNKKPRTNKATVK